MQFLIPQKRLGPRGFMFCLITVNLLTVIALDIYIPALPNLETYFDATPAYLNLTMFAFCITQPVGTVLAGPLSDRFGRKAVLMASCVLFTASSFAYGGIATVETAMLRDAFAGDDLKVAMTLLQSLFLVGAAFAPFLGTFVLTMTDWRGIFELLAACGAVCILLTAFVSETYPRKMHSANAGASAQRSTGDNLAALVRDRKFVSLSLLMSFGCLPYYAFLAVIPYVLLQFFALSYAGYSAIYAITCIVSIVAPFVYASLSNRMYSQTILKMCFVLIAASAVSMGLFGQMNPWVFLFTFIPYALAEGIVRPMSYVLLLNDMPSERVGTASSFTNFAFSVLTSFGTVFATLDWPNFITGIVVITGCALVIMCALYAWGLRSRIAPHDTDREP